MTHQPPLSRRDFVAATSLGAMGLLRGTTDLPEHRPSPPDAPLLYVGTYTEAGRREGILLLRMDSATGALRKVGAVDAGVNPSFLTIHHNGRTLFSVNERSGTTAGSVRAFAIDASSRALTPVAEQPSEGAAPCYVSTDRKGRFVMVANYTSGTIAMLPVGERGALARALQVVRHVRNGPVAPRQESAHAHCIIPHPTNRFVLVADLGLDRVLVYRFDEELGTLAHAEGSDGILAPASGPRHLVFHPRLPLVFVACELNSTVTTLRCDPVTGALSAVQTLSTLPASWTGANFPADIHVAPDGRALYVSNRGHNSIAVFSVAAETGALALEQAISTEGDWPRNFTLDPTGRWLLVANQRSGSIVVLGREVKSGRLAPTSHRIDVPSPSCLRFHPSA